MKKRIINIISGLIMAVMCLGMATPVLAAETDLAIDPRVELAVQTLYGSYLNGTDATIKFEATRAEAPELCHEVTRYLNGIISGVQLDVRCFMSGKDNPENAPVKVCISFNNEYPAGQLTELDADPRVIAEMEILNGLSSFEEKVTEVNRFVSSTATYDSVLAASGDVSTKDTSTTAMGCLNGLAVCQGYTNLASYFYERLGIQNVKVRCYIFQTDLHVFNMVRDDAGTMYVIDSTADHNGHHTCLTDLNGYSEKFQANMVLDPSILFEMKY